MVFLRAFPVGLDNVIDVLEASMVASFKLEPRDTRLRPLALVTGFAVLDSTLIFFWAGVSLLLALFLKKGIILMKAYNYDNLISCLRYK